MSRPLAPSDLIHLARQYLGPEPSVHFAPDIPPHKEEGARGVHRSYLPATEPIVVLYDGTLFGSAENGFVLTPERICWKNLLEHSRQVSWADLDPTTVSAEKDAIAIARGGVSQVDPELAAGTVRLILAMMERYVRPDAGPYRNHADAAEIPRLTALGRRLVGELEDVYYHPAIPPRMLENALAIHAGHLEAGEPVAILYDDTVFGGAKEGFLITPRRLCWKNTASDPEAIEWQHIPPETLEVEGSRVHILGAIIQLTTNEHLAAPVASLFGAIAGEARGTAGRKP